MQLLAQGIDPRSIQQGVAANQMMTDALMGGAELAGTASGKYIGMADKFAKPVQRGIQGMLAKGGGMGARNAIRFAGSAPVLSALRVVPAIGAAGAALGVGDIILGGDSAGNKAMDAAAMTVGGVLGSVGGPLGAAAGAGAGKAVSDGVQFLFGGGKSAEQRKMEEALALLRSGGMV